MLFLFQMHQDDSGWTYSKVDIDDDDDDDSDDDDDDDAVSWHFVWQTWRLRDKKKHDIFLLSTVLSSIELRGNDKHVTPAKD